MLAIYKKEMRSYFTTATGYIFLAIALIISSFVFSVSTILASTPTSDTSSYFTIILFVMIVFLPILTMRSFSEEKRTKTEQLLLTSPNSIFSLVMGKFLSAFTMYIIYIALSLLNFITLFVFTPEGTTPPNDAMIIGNFIALILLGMCFIAIGIFVSTLTENMFASAVITVGILLGLLVINGTSTLLNADSLYLFRYVIDWFSPFARFDAFVYGYFDIGALIYYLSVTGIFLFLSERVFQARRLS